MKLVINRSFGGFSLPKEFCEQYGFESAYADIKRDDERLINYVGKGCEIAHGFLTVVEIPDNATDYMINEYDGLEEVIYVVDGKIHIG